MNTHLASNLHNTVVALEEGDLSSEVVVAGEDGDGGLWVSFDTRTKSRGVLTRAAVQAVELTATMVKDEMIRGGDEQRGDGMDEDKKIKWLAGLGLLYVEAFFKISSDLGSKGWET